MSSKFNSKSGVGEIIKLREAEVYSITPNPQGEFVADDYMCLAKRVTLTLKQDNVYKTQFVNSELRKAVKPINENTKIILYNADGEATDSFQSLPELNIEYGSIVCQFEPKKVFTSVSVVIYTGPTVENLIRSDGNVTMDSDYKPIQDTDVATKAYADDLITNYTALSYPLKSFTITQGDYAPITAYCYLNNLKTKVLFIKNYNTQENLDDCEIVVDGFAIDPKFNPDTTQISLFINGTTSYTTLLKDIIGTSDSIWTLVSSENVFPTADVENVFWKNSYKLKFNLKTFASKYSEESPYLSIAVKVWDDEGHFLYSDSESYGIEELVTKADSKATVSFIEENFTKYKTNYVSGINYFPSDISRVYDLPVTVNIENNYLRYFRNDVNTKLLVETENGDISYSYDLTIDNHQPTTGSFSFNKDINFTIADKKLVIQVTNLLGDVLYEAVTELATDVDTSNETIRVTTPSAKTKYPSTGYGETWNSKDQLQEWDMLLKNGVYEKTGENSAVCFVINPTECYSHINANIEHDGEMYILSEGNTNWLNCQKALNVFETPVDNGKGCLVNDNYFSFGKVTYTSRVFIRIINASTVKVNSIELS